MFYDVRGNISNVSSRKVIVIQIKLWERLPCLYDNLKHVVESAGCKIFFTSFRKSRSTIKHDADRNLSISNVNISRQVSRRQQHLAGFHCVDVLRLFFRRPPTPSIRVRVSRTGARPSSFQRIWRPIASIGILFTTILTFPRHLTWKSDIYMARARGNLSAVRCPRVERRTVIGARARAHRPFIISKVSDNWLNRNLCRGFPRYGTRAPTATPRRNFKSPMRRGGAKTSLPGVADGRAIGRVIRLYVSVWPLLAELRHYAKCRNWKQYCGHYLNCISSVRSYIFTLS